VPTPTSSVAARDPAELASRTADHKARAERYGPLVFQVAVMAALLFVLYARILEHLAEEWIDDPNYSYGFFVLLFCGWIVWTKRHKLRTTPRKPALMGLAIIAGALALLVLGVYGAELYLSRTSLLFLIAGLIIYFLGWRMFGVVVFPWSILLLTIPLPAIVLNQLSLPLQFEATRLSSRLAELAGIPVLREGNIIVLPALTLDVADACSGLRSLMSLVTLAVFYGYIFEPRLLRRLLLIFAAIPIAVVANAVRIMGSGVAGEYWGPDKAQGFFHLFSGGVVFLCSLLLLFGFHAALKRLSTVAQRAR
jgi:exosortase